MNEGPPIEHMLGALLRIPFQAINERIARELEMAGYGDLRPAHFAVFQHLPADGARQTEIAERAQMTKQSMGALVEYLVSRGYLERSLDPDDGRARIIRRTDRGWDVDRIARASIGQLEDEWEQELGHERLREGVRFLRDLTALLEQ